MPEDVDATQPDVPEPVPVPDHQDAAAPPEADEHRDSLPEDLDVTAFVGPYAFPDNSRRRYPGLIELGAAALLVLVWVLRHDGGVLVNQGALVIAGGLAVVGLYHLIAAQPLKVRELDALAAAAKEVGFPVGHASAQMAWRGLRSTPTWRILLYSADEPPTKRGLVMVDGVAGGVLGSFVEDNPEDWDQVLKDAGAAAAP